MKTKETEVTGISQQILEQVRSVVVGKDAALLWVLAAILAGGHVLLEDVPGVGKTTMALAFSRVLDLRYSRVQFTPDVLPSDVTGYSVLDQNTGRMHYQPGAVLCNLFLADELNRATSRTQAALLEDIPGVGKTTMALAFSKVLDLSYSRVQFTPDVLPSDVTGYSVPDQQTGQLHYQPGAVLCNLFLADELNRATSRTQSALLEAMEEGQVTVDGVSHPLPKPFVVIATQNPTGAAGTSLLPDSQMDRFMIRLSLGYPNPKDEIAMVLNRQSGNPLQSVVPLMTRENLAALQETVAQTFMSDVVVSYLVDLISATRNHEDILRGASPRATLSVTAMAKAVARLRGRDYVIPGDVKEVFTHTVAHRLILSPKAEAQGLTPEQILRGILDRVTAPKLR